jgi:hypothetical protein
MKWNGGSSRAWFLKLCGAESLMLSLHFFLAGMGCLIDLYVSVAGSSGAKGLSMDAARILRAEESGVNRERALSIDLEHVWERGDGAGERPLPLITFYFRRLALQN